MRAFLGHADHSGLRSLVSEDAVPSSILDQVVRGWAAHPATIFRAVIDEDAAEAIRRELACARADAACVMLLNRAVEILPLCSVETDLPS